MKRFILAVIAILFGAVSASAHHIAQGDLDRDGDVDFADYLIFVESFERPYHELPRMAHDVDTLTVYRVEFLTDTITVRDTVTIKQTVTVKQTLPRPEILIQPGASQRHGCRARQRLHAILSLTIFSIQQTATST